MTKKNHEEKDTKQADDSANGEVKSDKDLAAHSPGNNAHSSSDKPVEPELSPEDILKQKIAELELELLGTKDKLLRAYADFDNFRKRNYREMTDLRTMVKADTITPMLNVFDHFKLALEAADKKPDFKILDEGMKMILAEFKKAMDDLDIEIINVPENTVFDPNIHDAAGNEPSDKIAEGKVIRQWRQGYKMGERILRPASVVVSSGPAKTEDNKPETEAEKKKD